MSHVGPSELLVVIFPGQETPACATAVLHAVDMSEGVRTVDAIMVVKDGVGRIRGDDLCEPPSSRSPNGHRHGGVADAMISAADIGEIGVLLTPHSSAPGPHDRAHLDPQADGGGPRLGRGPGRRRSHPGA